MKPADSVRLAILMLLLPIAGWIGRGGWDEVQHTRRCIALFRQAAELVHSAREDQAIPLLERATNEDPYEYEVWLLLAQCEYSKHDRSRTIAVYERARLFLPNDARLDQNLADMYALDGKYDLALEALTRARDLLGPDPYVMKTIDRVQRWKVHPPNHNKT
ncbi:MAG: tetratricopeptide repeat protein [Candidatus Xenobia bacterium]